MRDQSHRQHNHDEQSDEASGDDDDAQIYREHIESEHNRPFFSLLFHCSVGHVGVGDGDVLRLDQCGGLAHGGGAALHGRLGVTRASPLCRSTMAATARLCSAR